ncbi:hypothetical protein [uncultured Aquimarina sp.]|uniref:hypothetical protein n=1 Tax=uncultured Aquimarina sp. TaxID=575652 RepID=UPI0026049E8F|nr:hypothetical protein [uncultured Aquimarina sp.]
MKNLENLRIVELNNIEIETIDGGNNGYLWAINSESSGGSSIGFAESVQMNIEITVELFTEATEVIKDTWNSIFG